MAGQGTERRLIVHLGVQKTGSTAFHRLLAKNATRLERDLILRMPVKGSTMQKLGRAAINYALAPGKVTENRLRDTLVLIREALPDDRRNILISHENLAGAMPGNGGERRLFPMLPKIVDLVDKGLKPLGCKPHFVICTRSMADWKASVWAQAVRSDGYCGDWATFRAETAGLPDWSDLIDRLKAVVGGARLTRLRVEEAPRRDLPGSEILALAGLTSPEIEALSPVEQPAMARLRPGATEFLRQLNGLQLNAYPHRRVADLVAHNQFLFAGDDRPEGSL